MGGESEGEFLYHIIIISISDLFFMFFNHKVYTGVTPLDFQFTTPKSPPPRQLTSAAPPVSYLLRAGFQSSSLHP